MCESALSIGWMDIFKNVAFKTKTIWMAFVFFVDMGGQTLKVGFLINSYLSDGLVTTPKCHCSFLVSFRPVPG